jgi:hypothetical protein
MNYDTMEAGREMDALVAEKVMGWTKGIREGMPPVWYTPEPDGMWYVHRLCVTWCPSAPDRISDAWEVVEKLTAGGNGCFELQRDFGGRFNASFYIVLSDDDPRGEDGRYGNWQYECEDADTAPLAICRAALKAMEETK